jgi:hypothetical protein
MFCWRQILFGRKRQLWIPVPGIATHLDSKALSPNVDWRALMEQTKTQALEEVSAAKYSRTKCRYSFGG